MSCWKSRNWGSHTPSDGCEMAIRKTGVKEEEMGALPRSRDLSHPVLVDQSLICLGLQQNQSV